MQAVSIELLGPLRVSVGGQDVAIVGERRRLLLAALAVHRGRTCTAARLIELLWGDGAPAAAAATLQSHVSHLRRLLEPDRDPARPWSIVRTVPGGYSLDLSHVDVDIDRFTAAVHAGSGADDPALGVDLLESALRWCPTDDDAGVSVLAEHEDWRGERTRLWQLRRDAAERHLDHLVDLGRYDIVVERAGEAIAVDPWRERLWTRRAEALARCGRQREALDTLTRLRSMLGDELGLEPSPAVTDLEHRILTQDHSASWGSVASAAAPARMPTLRYANAGGVHIAYQMMGAGPYLVAAPPFAQNIEICWEDHHHRRLLEHLSAQCRFVHFDKRGTGMSDRTVSTSMEERLGDFDAVLDDIGADRAVLCGVSEGGPTAIAFAAAHPERVAGLVLINTFARSLWADDYPIGAPADTLDAVNRRWVDGWGQDPSPLVEWFAPSLTDDASYCAWLAHYMRQSCSPGTLAEVNRANREIDVRGLLADIAVPTLVIHRSGDRVCPASWGRYLAEHIPGATYVEVEGSDHLPWVGENWHEIADRAVAHTKQASAR